MTHLKNARQVRAGAEVGSTGRLNTTFCIRVSGETQHPPCADECVYRLGRALRYIGDVPPFIWQHSPWLRAGSWLVVTAMSLICAYIGAELFSQALDGGFVLLFGLLLYLRWAVSSLPSRFWVG